jgi:hypothetical protein
MNWKLVNDVLPEIGQEVLGYSTIGKFRCIYVCRITAITSCVTGTAGNYLETKSIDWRDDNGDSLTPTHWAEIDYPAEAAEILEGEK